MSRDLEDIAVEASRGGAYLFVGNTISLIISAVASIIIARLLGPSDYGLYSLVLTVPTLVVSLIGFGVGQAVVRYVAMFRAKGKGVLAAQYIKVGLLFQSLVGLGASLLILLYAEAIATHVLNRPGTGELVRVVSILILTGSVLGFCGSGFLGSLKMEYDATVKSLQAIIKLLLAPLLIITLGLFGALLGHIVSYIIVTVLALFLLIKIYRILSSTPSNRNPSDAKVGNWVAIKSMVSYGYPLYLPTLLGSFIGQVIFVLIAHFVNNYEIGNYSVAMNLNSIIALLSTVIGSILFPSFSKLSLEEDATEVKQAFKASVKYSTMLRVPAATFIAIFSGELIWLIYGSHYESAPIYLSLIAIGTLNAGVGGYVLGSFFSGLGWTRRLFWAWALGTSINLPITLLMLPMWGILGAIVAGLLGSWASTIYLLMRAKKMVNVELGSADIIRIYTSALVSAIISSFVLTTATNELLRLIVGGLIYLASYMVMLPLLGALRQKDVEVLIGIFKKAGLILYPLVMALKVEGRIIRTLKQTKG